MSKKLVLYFSVYGTAKNVAEEIAKQTGVYEKGEIQNSPAFAEAYSMGKSV